MTEQSEKPSLNEGDIIQITDARWTDSLNQGDIASVVSVEDEGYLSHIFCDSSGEEIETPTEKHTRVEMQTKDQHTSVYI